MIGACIALLVSPGCYYAHLARGQLEMMRARRPVEDVIADPTTAESLREELRLVEAARVTASALGLAVGEQYTSYVEWPGDRVVTTVVATRPREIEPASFHFPLVGSVPYKGFFSQERAEAEAASLEAKGMDVCLLAVPAYSTLGWLADPVTSPMLAHGRSWLFETIVHELVHATVFIESLPDFNESAASFIGKQAALAWFDEHDAAAEARLRARLADEARLAEALLTLREAVSDLYASSERANAAEGPDGNRRRERGEPVAAAELARQREALSRSTRGRIAELPLTSRDPAATAAQLRLGDACLAIRGTYTRDLPRHAALLAHQQGDLAAFVARLREAARHDDPEAWFFAPLEHTSEASSAR